MTLADYTRQELCLPDVPDHDGPGALLQLCRALQRGGAVRDSLAFYDQVVHQYLLGEADVVGTMGVVAGWAHSVSATAVAIGRTREPIAWQHNSRVQLIFLIAAPAAEANGAGVLATVARLGRDESVFAALCAAPSPEAMIAVLRAIPVADEIRTGAAPAVLTARR